MIKWFIAGIVIGTAMGWYSTMVRVEAERKKRAVLEKACSIEHNKRINAAVSYEDTIEKLQKDIEDYRAHFRGDVERRLSIDAGQN